MRLLFAAFGNFLYFCITMKRLAYILLALAMSLLLVWTGVGVAVLHCLHTGDVEALATHTDADDGCCVASGCEAGEPEPDCCSGEHDYLSEHCRVQKSGCMSVEIVKLSPTTRVTDNAYDHCTVGVWALVAALWLAAGMWGKPLKRDIAKPCILWNGPPWRRYLSFIRVLTI